MIHLADAYKYKGSAHILYALLKERERRVNISHRRMPSMPEHLCFFRSAPYKTWDLILKENIPVGSVYFSKQNEIGIFIFKKYRGLGYGKKAVQLLIKKHLREGRFLANVSPKNSHSIRFFKEFGFKHIQNTYELRKS